ncbi:hypothetical protein [Chryseobacterium takakiae]|uniref:Uncharacterized protein n=1 Tax=Chryseobacterium takakiae TaxID=1302685 RepID=A0A1M5A0N1_9FLAO|nr:hypothetical protein [Chryseobacterium takakiae]SHF23502.1 hypothetical protein SAMN05444408_111107 [Chryseobacterium takakiae]
MKYLYLNGKNSVALTYIEDSSKKSIVKDVFIDNIVHVFKDGENPNKEAYAEEIKRNSYKKLLNNQFENLAILTGAGSSVDIGNADKKGKILSQLWDDSENELTKDKFTLLCEKLNYDDKYDDGEIIKNLEKLLSIANTAKDYIPKDEIDIADCVDKIKNVIKGIDKKGEHEPVIENGNVIIENSDLKLTSNQDYIVYQFDFILRFVKN